MSRETVLDIAELARRMEADEYRSLGEERRAKGDISDAVAYYQISLELFPTVETHLALSEALAVRGLITEAIHQVRAALTLEPESGSANNALGVYLLQSAEVQTVGQARDTLVTEAQKCFEAAIRVPYYDGRNFPYFHLGRIAEQKARFTEARDYYRRSLEINNHWGPARVAFRRVVSWLN